jgi:hypothetical protein
MILGGYVVGLNLLPAALEDVLRCSPASCRLRFSHAARLASDKLSSLSGWVSAVYSVASGVGDRSAMLTYERRFLDLCCLGSSHGVAGDGGAAHVADFLGVVEGAGAVHGLAVVPDR